jgi:phosphoglycerol transferase MdoB-like AlkP superfamily enzyme
LFWYALFLAARFVFLIVNHNQSEQFGYSVLMETFYQGLQLDISMVCYVSVIPVLLWITALWIPGQVVLNRVLKTYNTLILVCLIVITIADAELYQHWGQKLNSYAFSFAKYPKDMLAFSTGNHNWLLILISLLFSVLAYTLYHYGMRGLDELSRQHQPWVKITVIPVVLCLLIFGIRGGFGKTPLSQSSAFFSTHLFLNHAALNTSWNFLASVAENAASNTKNPYAFTSETNAQKLIAPFFAKPSTSEQILTTKRPNIVLIILEGWSADVVESAGGEKNITPNFNKLAKQGIQFADFYASGNRTDKGLAAILSAQPALPTNSIINNIQKFTSLPSIPKSLKSAGYQNAFYYGGNSDFANMKGYWLSSGYDRILDLEFFPLNVQNAEWGVHDDILYETIINDIKTLKEPFLASILTLSSHEPFNVPAKRGDFSDDTGDKYRNAVWYSDSCLGVFFANAAKQPWYNNTLFIVLADHGHKQPKGRLAMDPELFHIPCMFVGNVIDSSWRGKTITQTASQVHLASTLLNQLQLPSAEFTWSSNLLDQQYVPYAAFTYYPGVGIATPQATAVWSYHNQFIERSKGDSSCWDSLGLSARAYLQLYYDEFMKR